MPISASTASAHPRLRRLPWLLAVVVCVAYVPVAAAHLRFVRDDWAHYVAMRGLHESGSWWDALSLLASNEWFGAHELRIFFGSFVTHFLIAPLGDAASTVGYVWLLSMHVGAAMLAGWVAWRLTASQVLGVSTMVVLTYFPAVAQPAMWVNNLFFVQPWFFFVLTIALAIALRDRPALAAVALVPPALVAAFSGESALPLLLGALASLPVIAWYRSRSARNVALAAVPLVAVVAALAAYLAWVVSWPDGSDLEVSRLSTFGGYLTGAQTQFLGLVDVTSAYFGAGSVGPSVTTLVLTAVLAAAAVVAIGVARSSSLGARSARRWAFVAALAVGLVLSIIPWALGVVTGARPGPDLRYLYLPSAFLVMLVLALLDLFSSATRPSPRVVARVVVAGLAAYSVFATMFNVIDIWGMQRTTDDRIWSALAPLVTDETEAIVTFHPDHPYLMAPYHSNAVSDFQADWGVAGRIAWEHPDRERILVFRDATAISPDEIAARHYYDTGTTCVPARTTGGEPAIVYMAFDYGPALGDFPASPLLVTTDYEEFARVRESMIARSATPQTTEPWMPCDAIDGSR